MLQFGLLGGAGNSFAVSINQTFAGSCNLDTANPCTATSTHQAVTYNEEGIVTFLWTVNGGATIITGQGTDTVQVEDNGGSDSSFLLTCEVSDDLGTASRSTTVNHDRYVTFDGGLFVNGGFENGLVGWENFGDWTVPADKQQVENPGTNTAQILYQNFTLDEGGIYAIAAQQLQGNAEVNFMINDADSGINIKDGVHTFEGEAVARSTGIFIHTAGTAKLVVDSIKLNRLDLSCAGMDLCMLIGLNEGNPNIAGFSLPNDYGTVRPQEFLEIPIHSITFDNSTGNCITRMGPDGITKVPLYNEMAWTFSDFAGEVNFVWDEVEFRYEATNQALADHVHTLIDDYMGLLFMPVIFDPLEDNPDWQFIAGTNTESYLHKIGRAYGKILTSSGQENFVANAPFELWNDMQASCILTLAALEGDQNYSMFQLVIRGRDPQNYIGLRTYNGTLDVYEKVNNAWNPLNQNPVTSAEALGKKVTLRVEGRKVSVLIDDVETGDYADCGELDTLKTGYCGIMDRPSQATEFSYGFTCEELKIAYVGGSATPTIVYLAFDRDPSGIPPSITINAGGVDLTTLLIEQSGQQLVVTTSETITAGQTVLATIDGTGTNVPNLTNSFVQNNTARVTYKGEIVTYNGVEVTYDGIL